MRAIDSPNVEETKISSVRVCANSKQDAHFSPIFGLLFLLFVAEVVVTAAACVRKRHTT